MGAHRPAPILIETPLVVQQNPDQARLREPPCDGLIGTWLNIPRPAVNLLPSSRLCHLAWRVYASDEIRSFSPSVSVLRNRATVPCRGAHGASASSDPSRARAEGAALWTRALLGLGCSPL